MVICGLHTKHLFMRQQFYRQSTLCLINKLFILLSPLEFAQIEYVLTDLLFFKKNAIDSRSTFKNSNFKDWIYI